MAGDTLKQYGIGQFQSVAGTLPSHRLFNWKSLGNSFDSFQYFKNCNDMSRFLKKHPDAIQDAPPETIVHDQRNTWHDPSTFVDTYTQRHPWEMDELEYYYGSEYRATTNSFPTPKEFYSTQLTKFTNWFQPDPKKFFVAGSNKNEQKQRLLEAFVATKKRFKSFLKLAPPDHNNTFFKHLIEMNEEDPEDRDRIEDILLHFHHLGMHIAGYWTFYKTASSKVLLYNPKLDFFFGYIKSALFPRTKLYDKSIFFYVSALTFHFLWKLERQPQSAKPQIRPGPQSKAQLSSFTGSSPGHHVGQSRAEKEMLSRGAMVAGRIKHYPILPYTIEFGQPTPPYTDMSARFEEIGNFRVERYPVPINMDEVELIPQKSNSSSLASNRNPPPRNAYRPKVVFETSDDKIIAAYTLPGINFQYGNVHRLDTMPREPPVDIRHATLEKHTTFLTPDGYFKKYHSSVAVNNTSAQIEPKLLFCDIPNMLETEPDCRVDSCHAMTQDLRRATLNPTVPRQPPRYSNGNFGGMQNRQGQVRQVYLAATTPNRATHYRVIHPITKSAGTGAPVMVNRPVGNVVYTSGQQRPFSTDHSLQQPQGNTIYRRVVVRNVAPMQRMAVQPIQRLPPIEYNTMMKNGPGLPQPRRQYTTAPTRQAEAAVRAAQQRVMPLQNKLHQNYVQAPIRLLPVAQERSVPEVGNECALMADLFYQQVSKEVVVNEEGIQIEEHDMPILDREQGMSYNYYDQPTTSQFYPEEHRYCKANRLAISVPLKARSQTAPAPLHRQNQRTDVQDNGVSGLDNDMGGSTNQLNVAGPSKIEHKKRIKKKEVPAIEDRPHLNKPTRTRYNGRAASMEELPPFTKPRHPDGPKPVNVSVSTLAAHIPQGKEMLTAQTKRGPGRPKKTTSSRGAEGHKQKEIIVACLQIQQPEVVPLNMILPAEIIEELSRRQEETLKKIFAPERKPAKRRKARSLLAAAPRKSKGRKRQYVKQDVKVQKEMDLAVVGAVLDLLNHFGDIPDPVSDLKAIPLSRKSINIKKGMRTYMERRRLLWRLRCDGPVNSLTAPKTKAKALSTRDSSVSTASGMLESLLNLGERQMTKKGYERTIVECLDELVDQVEAEVVPEKLQSKKKDIEIITLEEPEPLPAIFQEDDHEMEEQVLEEIAPELEEEVEMAPNEQPDYFDEVDQYVPTMEVSTSEEVDQVALKEMLREVQSVVEDVMDKVTTTAEVVLIPEPVDLSPEYSVEDDLSVGLQNPVAISPERLVDAAMTALEDVDDFEVPEPAHIEEVYAIEENTAYDTFAEEFQEEPTVTIEPVTKESFDVVPEAAEVIDFLCSKLQEQEAFYEPVVEKSQEKTIQEEPTGEATEQSWTQEPIDVTMVASNQIQEEIDEPEIIILEVAEKEILTPEEPVDSEIASLVDEILTKVLFADDLRIVVEVILDRVELEHNQEEEVFVDSSLESPASDATLTGESSPPRGAIEAFCEFSLIAGVLYTVAKTVAIQVPEEPEVMAIEVPEMTALETETLETFAEEIAETAILFAAESASEKMMEFQDTTEEMSTEPIVEVPAVADEPQMPPTNSQFPMENFYDGESDMGDLSVPLYTKAESDVVSIIEAAKSPLPDADSEGSLGVQFEDEADFFNFKEPADQSVAVESQPSTVAFQETDESKSVVDSLYFESDAEDQAIRNRTFSEISGISEETASKANHHAFRSETPETIITSREQSPAVEDTIAKTVPLQDECVVEEPIFAGVPTVNQSDEQLEEDIQRLLDGDGPGAPGPPAPSQVLSALINDDESVAVNAGAVAQAVPPARIVKPITYAKEETMLHTQLPHLLEQDNVGMGPYQLQNNNSVMHHNYSQPVSGWSTTPFARAQQPPMQQGYPQQMQNAYYHQPPQYPHMNQPWGMNPMNTYQRPAQGFPPIQSVYQNPMQAQIMNHNVPGPQPFNGGFYQGPVQQMPYNNFMPPQHHQQPMQPMVYQQGQGQYPGLHNQMPNQEIRRQLEQRQMRAQRPVQPVRHEPREVVVNIYRPVPEDSVNAANFYRAAPSHYNQYSPGLPQPSPMQHYPPPQPLQLPPVDQLPPTPRDRINRELDTWMAIDLQEREKEAQATPTCASNSSSRCPADLVGLFDDKTPRVFSKENVYGVSNYQPHLSVSDLLTKEESPFNRKEKAKRLKNVPQHYDRLPGPFDPENIIANSGELEPVTDESVYKSVNRAVLTLIKAHRQSKKPKEKNLFMSQIWTTHMAHHVLAHIQSALPNIQSTVSTVHYEMSTAKLRLSVKAALKQLENGEAPDTSPLDCTSREPSNVRNAKFLSNFLASVSATPIDKSQSNKVDVLTTEPSKFYDENPTCREIRSLRDYLQLFLNTVPDEGIEDGNAELCSSRCVFMVFYNYDPEGNVIGCHNFVMSYGALLKGATSAQVIKVGPFRPYRTDASRNPNSILRLGHGGVDSTVELDSTHNGCELLYYSGLYDRVDPKQYATFLCCSMGFKPLNNHKELLEQLGLTLFGVAKTPEKRPASNSDLRLIARENPTKRFRTPDVINLDRAIPPSTEKICLVYNQRITLDHNAFAFKDYTQAVDTILSSIGSHFDSSYAQGRIRHDIMRPFAFAQMYCENIYKNLICYGISNAFLTAGCSPSNSIGRRPLHYQKMSVQLSMKTPQILGDIFTLFTKEQAENCFNEIQTLVENNANLSVEEKKIVVSERAYYHISKINIAEVLLGNTEPPESIDMTTGAPLAYIRQCRDLMKLQPAWNHRERDFERERIVDFGLNDSDFDQRQNYDQELWAANTPEERKAAMINIAAKVFSQEEGLNFDMVKKDIVADWKDDVKLSITPSDEEIEKTLRPLPCHTRAVVQSLFLWERIHAHMDTSVKEGQWTIEGLNKLFPRLMPVGMKAQAIKEQLVIKPEPGNFRIKIRQLKQLESPILERPEGAKDNGKEDKRNDGNNDQQKRRGAKRKDRDDDQNGPPTKAHNGSKSYNQYSQDVVNFAVPSLPYLSEADLGTSGVRNYAESIVSVDSGIDSLPSIDIPTKTTLSANDEMTTLQAAIDIWETASIRSTASLPIVEKVATKEKDSTKTAVSPIGEKRKLSVDAVEETAAPLDYTPIIKKSGIFSEVQPIEVLRVDTSVPLKPETPQIMSPCSVSSSDSGSRDGKKRGQSYLLFNSLYGILTEDVHNSSQSSRCTSEEIDIVGRKKESPRPEQDNRFIVPSSLLVAKKLSPLASKRSSQSQEPSPLPVEKVHRVEQVQDFHQDTVPNVKEEIHFHYKKRYVIQKDFNAKTATISVSKRRARGKRSVMPPSAKAEIINRLFNEGKHVLPLIFDGNSLALATMEELWDKTNLPSTSGIQRRVRKTCSTDSVSSMDSSISRRLTETLKRPLTEEQYSLKRMRVPSNIPEPLNLSCASRPLIITKAALKELPYRTSESFSTLSINHENKNQTRAHSKIPLRSPLTDSDSDVEKGLVIDTGSDDDEGVASEDEQEPFVIYDIPSSLVSPSSLDSPTHIQLKEVSRRLLIDIPFTPPTRLPKLYTKAKSAGHSPIGYLFAEKMSLKQRFSQFRKQGRMTGLNERLKEPAVDHCANGKLLRKFVHVAEKELHRRKASDHCDVFIRKSTSSRRRSQSTDRFFPRSLKDHFAEVWEIAQDSMYLEDQCSPLPSPSTSRNIRCRTSSSALCSPSKSIYRSPLAQDARFPGYEQLLDSFMPKSPDGLLYFRSLDLEHVYFPYTYSALLSQQFMKPF